MSRVAVSPRSGKGHEGGPPALARRGAAAPAHASSTFGRSPSRNGIQAEAGAPPPCSKCAAEAASTAPEASADYFLPMFGATDERAGGCCAGLAQGGSAARGSAESAYFQPLFGDAGGPGGRAAASHGPAATSSDHGPAGEASSKAGVRPSDLAGGRTLSRAVTAPFEASYGAPLGDVRVQESSPLPRRFGWDAMTLGDAVAFAPGHYRPDTSQGLALLGHELAHVVQQRRGGMRAQAGIDEASSTGAEREAWSASHAALSGKRASLGGVPLRPAGGSAGGCFMPGVPGHVVGTRVHQYIQSLYNGFGIYSEVTVPGVSFGAPDDQRADLVWATGPDAVPPGQTARIRPPGYITSPPHSAPDACAVGEIKPITGMMAGDGVAQLNGYIEGMNAHYTRTAGVQNTGPLVGVIPPSLIAGEPFFIRWPPQALHLIPGALGVYYYMCRPMGELLPIMEYLRQQLREWMRQLRELLRRFPELRPILEPILEPIRRMVEALGEALRAAAEWAWDHFWEIVLVLAAIALVVLFFAEIVAFLAAVVAALEAILVPLVAAVAAFVAFLGLTSDAEASEPPPEPPREPPPPEPPYDGPGCFPAGVLVRLASGRDAPIESIRVGDEVIAWDEEANRLRPCPVVELHRHPPEPLLELSLSDGHTLVVTHLHSLRATTGWVLARDVREGDVLLTAGEELTTATVRGVRPSERLEPVHNFTVGDCPTYLAEGVVVHNLGMAKRERAPRQPPAPQ